jgi:hypothetical protein
MHITQNSYYGFVPGSLYISKGYSEAVNRRSAKGRKSSDQSNMDKGTNNDPQAI